MNEWNRMQLSLDEDGFVESCDRCNALIPNWEWMGNAFVTFDSKIVCNNCRTDLLKGLEMPVTPSCSKCGKSDSMIYSHTYDEWVCHHTHRA